MRTKEWKKINKPLPCKIKIRDIHFKSGKKVVKKWKNMDQLKTIYLKDE